jgi:polysaccharide export outer membrane protein
MITLKWPMITFTLALALPIIAAAGPAPAGPVPGTPSPTRSAPAGSRTAQAVSSAPSAESTAPSAAVHPMPLAAPSEYVIGPDDILLINVWKNETLSRTVPVRPDGKVSMPLLHDIQAGGLTAMQLRDKIAVALGEFMPNPEVSVTVTEVRSFKVSVLGEVQKPGVLQLRSATTVLEAIAMAGGFRDFASPSKIMIIRKDLEGRTQKIRFNYNRVLSTAGEEDNLLLKTGDVIVVP